MRRTSLGSRRGGTGWSGLWAHKPACYSVAMSAPTQPDLPEPTPATATMRKEAIQAHRKAVLEFAQQHPLEWVPYWTSPTRPTATSVKSRFKQYTTGKDGYTLKHRNGVTATHGRGWSMVVVDSTVMVRWNGPKYESGVPEMMGHVDPILSTPA